MLANVVPFLCCTDRKSATKALSEIPLQWRQKTWADTYVSNIDLEKDFLIIETRAKTLILSCILRVSSLQFRPAVQMDRKKEPASAVSTLRLGFTWSRHSKSLEGETFC